MQESQGRIFTAEEKNISLMQKENLLTNLCGNTSEKNMEEELRSQSLNTLEWKGLGYFSSLREEKQMKESEFHI